MLSEQGPHENQLTHVGCMAEAEQHLAAHTVDVILLDLGLPDAQGLGAIRRAHAAAPRVPLVVLTGLDDESLAVQALQEGAEDYLVKGQIEARGLRRAVRYAIERKIMEEALFVEKERAQVTLNSIGDGVICTNVSGGISFLNAVAQRMTGWSWQEAAGRPLDEVFRRVDTRSRENARILSGMASAQESIAPSPSSHVLVRRDGFETPIEDSIAPIHDRAGHPTGAVVVFRDVSAARAMSLQMAHSAEHDSLTGLPNRRLLADRLSQSIALARRHQKYVAVLFLDLDASSTSTTLWGTR
jgi:PAS domain S-box-containing protein